MENTFLAGRITYTDVSQQLLLFEKLIQEPDIIIYEHHEREDNLHIHFLVANPSKSREDTYTKWVKEICGDKDPNGSRRYSYKRKQTTGINKGNPVDLDFISYMSKGHLHPIRCHSVHNIFTPAIIEPLRQKGFDIKNNKLSQNTEDALNSVKSKVTEYTMVKEVIAAINPPEDSDLVYTVKEIYPAAKKVREKNQKILPAKQMAEFVQKCQFYLNPDDYGESVMFWHSYLTGKKYSV